MFWRWRKEDWEAREKEFLEFVRKHFPEALDAKQREEWKKKWREDFEPNFKRWRKHEKNMHQWQRQEWERQRKLGKRWARRQNWRRRWGLRRRLTAGFAFVALAAVGITTWFTLGAVFSALFAGSHPAGWVFGGWNNPQFAQAREIFGRVTGTAFWAGTISFVLAVVAAAGITQVLIRPLIALTDGAKRLEAGERGIRLRMPPKVGRSRDELWDLTEAFNNLVAGLERQEGWRRNLVADIAHDLRTPLSVLRSEIEAMQDGVSRPDADGLDRLHGQVMLLSKLVDDLRTLSLAESGGMNLRLEPVELGSYLQEVVEMFTPQAAKAAMQIKLSPVPKLTATLDGSQMTRVLNNLLDNAVRYGAGPLELQAKKSDNALQIELRDHGPGLSQEALERVFDRFYRGDTSRTRAEGKGGSGLGLTIARAIVETHGGKLEAANHSEGGAVFTIWLPA